MKPNPLLNERLFAPLALTVFLLSLVILARPVHGLDFTGSLQGVTITDAAGANQPPSAVIKYTQAGNVVTFDASGSGDADGMISEYRWDFGDTTSGAGVKTSHQYQRYGSYPVTLAVIDNGGGVGLSQIMVAGVKPFAYFKLAAPGTGANAGKIYDEISGNWVGSGASAASFAVEDNLPCLKSTGPANRVGIPVGNFLPNGVAKFTISFKVKVTDSSLWGQSPLYFASGGNEFIVSIYDNASLHPTLSVRTAYKTVLAIINNNFSNNVWKTVRITSDAEAKIIRVWIDSVEQTVSGSTANMGNWGTLSGTIYFGYLATTGRTMFVNEFQIWHQIIPGS